MLNIGPQELLLILVVALLVVGPRRLPELGRSLGKGLREIRKAQSEVRKTIQLELDDEPAPVADRDRRPRQPSGGAGSTTAPETDGSAPSAAAAAGSAVGEVSKTLGRSLAELRKARQEIQRSFRVDLEDSEGDARQPRAAPSAPEPADAEADETRAADAGPSPG